MRIVAQSVSRHARVGDVGEAVADQAFLELAEAGELEDLRRQVHLEPEEDSEQLGYNFVEDIVCNRQSDGQPIACWVTHRTSSENSDSYFWGLVNQVMQVRRFRRQQGTAPPLNILLIYGKEEYWKGWIFPAATLIFDYVLFVGEAGSDFHQIRNFDLQNAQVIEEEIESHSRLRHRSAPDLDDVFDSFETTDELVDSTVGTRLVEQTKDGLSIESLEPNPYAGQLLDALVDHVQNHVERVNRDHWEAKDSDLYHNDIELLVGYTLLLLNQSVSVETVREVIQYLYDNSWFHVESQLEELTEIGFASKDGDMFHVNPKFLGALVSRFSGGEFSMGKDELYLRFVYGSILTESILSESQLDVMEDLCDRAPISSVNATVEFLNNEVTGTGTALDDHHGMSVRALRDTLESKYSLLERREHVLDTYIEQGQSRGFIHDTGQEIIVEESVEDDLDITENNYLFTLTQRSDRMDSYIMDLLDEQRLTRIRRYYSELQTIIDETTGQELIDNLRDFLEQVDENNLRIPAEVAIYAANLSKNDVKNEVESNRASTKFDKYLRAKGNLNDEEYNRFIELLIGAYDEHGFINSPREVSDELRYRRRDQVRRNVTTNPLEERTRVFLQSQQCLYVGGPDTQADAYIQSLLDEVGLSVYDSAPSKRGEDFVVPLRGDDTALSIVCRRSPTSHESQRMSGHSIQFIIGWDQSSQRFYIKDDLRHIALIDGSCNEQFVSVLLGSVFDAVYSGDEMEEMYEDIEASRPIVVTGEEYEDMLDRLQDRFAGTRIDPTSWSGTLDDFT